jgi:hypothetical protein
MPSITSAADDASGDSMPIDAQSSVQICAPGNLRVWRNAPGTARLTWDEPWSTCRLCPDAQSFEVSGEGMATITVDRPPCDITGLLDDREYQLFVRARAGENNWSLPSPVTMHPKPGKPQRLRISDIGSTSAYLSWAKPSSKVEVFDYEVTCNGRFVKCQRGLYLQVNELQSDSAMSIEVTARTVHGQRSEPLSGVFRTLRLKPAAPIDLRFADLTYSSLRLTWSRGDDVVVAGYQVSRNGAALRTVLETAYEANWLSHSRDYLFEVRARDFRGNLSDPVQVNITTPGAPTRPGLPRGLRLDTSVKPRLTWSPPVEGDPIQYMVSRDDLHWATTLASPVGLCPVELPADGMASFYEVRAKDKAGQYSDPVGLAIGFVPPQEFHLSNLRVDSFNLRWAVPPGSVGVTGYQLSLNDGQPFTVVETSYRFTDLSPGTEYAVMVRTRSDAEDLSEPAVFKVSTLLS